MIQTVTRKDGVTYIRNWNAGRGVTNDARQSAILANVDFYEGAPCPKCGSTKRRTWSGQCPPCFTLYMRDYRAKRRAAK